MRSLLVALSLLACTADRPVGTDLEGDAAPEVPRDAGRADATVLDAALRDAVVVDAAVDAAAVDAAADAAVDAAADAAIDATADATADAAPRDPPLPLPTPPPGCPPGPCRLDAEQDLTTRFTYDARGRLTATTTTQGETWVRDTEQLWDERLLTDVIVRTPEGTTHAHTTWQDGHRVRTEHTRDGRPAGHTLYQHRWLDGLYLEQADTFDLEGMLTLTTTRTFDAAGRLVRTSHAPYGDEVTALHIETYNALTLQHTYLEYGEVVRETTTHLDACGHPTETREAGQIIERWSSMCE